MNWLLGTVIIALLSTVIVQQFLPSKAERHLQIQVQSQSETITELLNRIQAGDLKSYTALQDSSKPKNESESKYQPRDDESEVKLWAALGGDIIHDYSNSPGGRAALEEFGLDWADSA